MFCQTMRMLITCSRDCDAGDETSNESIAEGGVVRVSPPENFVVEMNTFWCVFIPLWNKFKFMTRTLYCIGVNIG